MKGRWSFLVNGLLVLAVVGFVSACGDDDDDDDNGGSGGSAGSSASGSGGSGGSAGSSTAGSGGSSAGSGGSMAGITPEMCVSNSMKETPMTPMACLTCICGKDAKKIDAVDAPGWKLIECIGAKCDGVGSSPCVTMPPPGGCGDLTMAGAATAVPTTDAFTACMMECGIGDMSGDGGVPAGGDAGL
jgi:hypothetical protein